VRSDAEQEFDKGLSLFNKARYAEAATHFDKATSLDPNYGVAYLYLGRSYVSLRQWGKALPALRTALRLAPDETRKEALTILTDALFSASVSEFHKGNLKSSGKYLDEATQLDPFRSDIPLRYRETQEP
jgi:tetratricopeptide (TPR) repeat protein